MKPQPRPALKRADDAELHPALSMEPTQLPTRLAKDLAGQQLATAQAAQDRAGKDRSGKETRKPAGNSERRKPDSGKFAKSQKGSKPFQSAGQATSDSLRGKSGKSGKSAKQVRLDIQVPKKLRKELRAIAKHSGSSVDSIVTNALTDWLGDPRRW